MNLNNYNVNAPNLLTSVSKNSLLIPYKNESSQKKLELSSVKNGNALQPVSHSKYCLPASKEWYSNIYSYNKNNIILAPQISEWTYNISKSYLNASPKKNKMDNIMIIKKRTGKGKRFSKVYFSLQDYAKKTSLYQSDNSLNKDHKEFLSSIMDKKVRNIPYAQIYLNKYLSLFRKNFKVDSNVKKRSMKFFYAKKAISTSFGLQNSTSLKQNVKKRYSILKTFLTKPEIGYSNNKTKIVISIYNKKSRVLLKELKSKFNLIKGKLKKPSYGEARRKLIGPLIKKVKENKTFKLNSVKGETKKEINKIKSLKPYLRYKSLCQIVKKLKKKFIYKLHNKPITSLYIYMWNHMNATSLSTLNKNAYLFNNVVNTTKASSMNKLEKSVYGLQSLKNLFFFKHSFMLYLYENYKLNSNNTLPMKNVLHRLFLKKTFLYIISLKYWNLDSKIVADIVTTKLIDRTKKVLKVLGKSIRNVPIFNLAPTILKLKEDRHINIYWKKKEFHVHDNMRDLSSITDTSLHTKLSNHHILFVCNKYKKHLLLDNLQHKWRIGTTIEAKGRITKRKTAQRSLKKVKYIGTLANLLSSRLGESTSLARGINKSNLQYVNNNNYNTNGSFGLKVSISSLQTLQKWNINLV